MKILIFAVLGILALVAVLWGIVLYAFMYDK